MKTIGARYAGPPIQSIIVQTVSKYDGFRSFQEPDVPDTYLLNYAQVVPPSSQTQQFVPESPEYQQTQCNLAYTKRYVSFAGVIHVSHII